MNDTMQISSAIIGDCRRGQSKLHRELTHRARGWLANRSTGSGIRAAFEVWLAPQYVADTVALFSFQSRFYLDVTKQEPIILTPGMRKADKAQINKLIEGRPSADMIAVFESKVSRADFLSTFSKWTKSNPRFVPPGNLHFVVTPRNLVTPDELPPDWGLLEAYGAGLSLKRWPTYVTQSREQYNQVAKFILWAGSVWEHAKHEWCPDCRKRLESDNEDG